MNGFAIESDESTNDVLLSIKTKHGRFVLNFEEERCFLLMFMISVVNNGNVDECLVITTRIVEETGGSIKKGKLDLFEGGVLASIVLVNAVGVVVSRRVVGVVGKNSERFVRTNGWAAFLRKAVESSNADVVTRRGHFLIFFDIFFAKDGKRG